MISVQVGLMSGRTVALCAELDEEVDTLRQRAQIALGGGRGRLVDSSGGILDGRASLKRAGVQNGDSLTLHVKPSHVARAYGCFAAVRGDGSVVTWGDPEFGGDSTAVQDELKNVQRIQRQTLLLLPFGSMAPS